MRFSDDEIAQLLKAWAAISFAFAVALGGGITNRFVQNFVLAALTVGVAFLLHEMAHKFVAQKFGCWAEFRSFDLGLLLAVVMSFTGFIFAAPGAVMIAGLVTTEENGKIAVAGPIINIILALLFLGLGQFVLIPVAGGDLVRTFVAYGYQINAWLALFNLFPFGPLDGTKVLNWSTRVWLLFAGVSAALVFLF